MSQQPVCPTCGVFLVEPYIQCAECKDPPRSFCLQCFAKGREYESHKNNHAYVILRNNFSILDPDWMASEELQLLDAILECGIGNWSDVAKIVGSKNAVECERHYFEHYIDNPKSPLFPVPEPEVVSEVRPTPIAYISSEDPPRPTVGSAMYHEMAGYMPARGDFAIEYDDYAELDIKDLDFVEETDPLRNEVQKSVLRIYQSRLKERGRRKLIIKKFGLISMKRNAEDEKRYELLGKLILDKMKGLMHLFKPEDYYQFLEGVLHEEKLKQRIEFLQECRDAGITRLHGIDTYLKLKKKREQRQRHKSALDDVLSHVKDEHSCHQFIRRQVLKENIHGLPDTGSTSGRRPSLPLPIAGLPGYEKLTSKERDLCANFRLLPNCFLQHKSTLIQEYRKLGSLSLGNARVAVKIDVNRTRKIFDLLVEEGLISKGT